MVSMEMTGWLNGQVFLQTVDEKEVGAVSEFLDAGAECGVTRVALVTYPRIPIVVAIAPSGALR